ncbi:MAG: hypothetical protein RL217_1633 [Pseudomonadota bacterium]|jgi:hypothetical protein
MKALLGALCLLAALSAQAGKVLDDEYYSNDIFRAIEEAKERTHHYDYSSALRYNRSTSQSIQIPRLLNKDMAKSSIETPELDQQEPETPVSLGENKIATNSTDSSRLQSNTPSNVNFNSSSVTVRTYLSN